MILTLEEAIAKEEGIVAENERFCAVAPPEITAEAYHSATYHRQIAGWLKELAGHKTGKWVKDEYGTDHCSCCNYIPAYDTAIDDIYYSPYCPNCGAKMEDNSNAD